MPLLGRKKEELTENNVQLRSIGEILKKIRELEEQKKYCKSIQSGVDRVTDFLTGGMSEEIKSLELGKIDAQIKILRWVLSK